MFPRASRGGLGTFDAVAVGLGAMLGAGVFAAFAPAARAAGAGLLVGLEIAGARFFDGHLSFRLICLASLGGRSR